MKRGGFLRKRKEDPFSPNQHFFSQKRVVVSPKEHGRAGNYPLLFIKPTVLFIKRTDKYAKRTALFIKRTPFFTKSSDDFIKRTGRGRGQ